MGKGLMESGLKILDKVRLLRDTHWEHNPQVRAGATGTLLSVDNVFAKILLDEPLETGKKISITEIVMFSDEVELLKAEKEKE